MFDYSKTLFFLFNVVDDGNDLGNFQFPTWTSTYELNIIVITYQWNFFMKNCLRSHAFEARIYAENIPKGFLPATGVLHRYCPVTVTSAGADSIV